ncbi:MAG: ATP-binding cassette domain-containing protein, partial [Alphaproteobacteria bacterium]
MIALVGTELHLESAGGEVNILRGIDLTVKSGETLGVVGPSGSGKSTMMMVIAGLERPTGGSVHVGGENLSDLDEDALARFRRHKV